MSSSLADRESRVAHARRVHDVAGRVYAAVGEDRLRAGNGQRAIPEAWAFHHAAEALAEAEALLAMAQAEAAAMAEAEAQQARRQCALEQIVKLLASGPTLRDALLSAAGPRRIAHEALSTLEIRGVVASYREGKRMTCRLMSEATAAA
jgi:hypothetical protein